MEASEHLRKGLELCGYTLVHTWRNGKNIDEIYERSQVFNTPDAVCIYNNGILIGVRTERATGSYLLANEILSNPDQYIPIDQDVSWCCTSGVVTYYNENKEVFYTVFSAAGHGSVANEIPSDKVTPKMKEAWARIEQNMIENAERAAWGCGGP